MYKNFFGLRENPFNVNPDPRFLYLTPQTQEALDQLTYGIQNRKGFILLTGEAGTGKTTLINYLLDWLRHQKMPTAFIFNSHLSVNELFDFILTDFGIPIDFELKSNMLVRLNKWLIERFCAGETPVLIVDEAQGLSFELLEEVRLLLNLETASEKLLQIVLVGQPELEDKLKRPELRQLRQRITLRCNTAPLTLEESYGYIADRLRIGGATRAPIFASDAMEAVHFYSRGIPRVMNLLCEHALINAYVEQLNPVSARMVEEAARDFLLDEFRPVTTSSSNVSVSLNDLIAALPRLEAKQNERGLCLDSIACPSDSAAQLIAEMKRNLAAVSPIAPLHLMPPRGGNEPSSAAKSNQMSASGNRALTLDTMNQLPRNSPRTSIHALLLSWKSWSPHWGTRFLPTISLTEWSRVSFATLRRIRQSTFLVQVLLRRWMFEFKRDWMAMINAIVFPQTKKSLLRWLRQSVSSKPMASSKNQPV